MTPSDERTLNRSEDGMGEAHARLVDDLTRLYRAAPPPSSLDSAVLQAVRAAWSERGGQQARTSWWRLHLPNGAPSRRRAGLATLATALALVLGSTAGYLRLSAPTPVSAETVLRHAAALQLAPNQAAHMVDNVSMTWDGRTASGTADVWLQTDASGATALSAQTLTIGKPGVDTATVPATSSRFIQVGQHILAYNPELRGDNMIMIATQKEMRGYPSWVVPNDVFDGASVAQSLSTLAQESPQQVRLLPQQTLDGVPVDAIEVDGWSERPAQRTTFYFDAQTYVLRGFDAVSLDPSYPTPSWQARLSSYQTMPSAAVPPATFALNAPATASIAPLDLGGPAFSSFEAAMTATCHSSVDVKLLLQSGQSLLAACQVTAPGMTAADLVAALAAPDKAALDAAAAAGVLTPAQADAYLSQVEAQLTTWVTSARNPNAPAAPSGRSSK